jgi:hypothetical protein
MNLHPRFVHRVGVNSAISFWTDGDTGEVLMRAGKGDSNFSDGFDSTADTNA